jgi:hypothetical protein
MQTLLGTSGTPEELVDRPARSSPPWVWFGFVFPIAFFVSELVELFLELDKSFQLVFILIILAGWIYWLFCVHRFHKILEEMTAQRYSIGAGEAVGKHFIPFYNIYWIFAWPSTMSSHLNGRGQVQMLPGGLIGFGLLVSILLRYVDGALGLALTFAIGMYISARLRQHMKAFERTSADMLPPLPDPTLFQPPSQTAAGTNTT